MEEEDEFECPLCLEELDLSDRKFKPCECGYQICRFCWHHIKEEGSGTCPACRRMYADQPAEFEPVDPSEMARMQKEKKQKEREKREMENANRRHLANMRVVQKNLVYVVGLSAKLAFEDTLRQHEYFGQYGRIAKVVVSKRATQQLPDITANASLTEPNIYVTFIRKEDAARCIAAVEGTLYEGRMLRATYGTTKYCTFYLRGLVCQNPNCMYLHEPGEDADSYTREEMATGKHHAMEMEKGLRSETQYRNNAVGPKQSGESGKAPWKSIAQSHQAFLIGEDQNSLRFFDHCVSLTQRIFVFKDGSALPATAAWAKIRGDGTKVVSKPAAVSLREKYSQIPCFKDLVVQGDFAPKEEDRPIHLMHDFLMPMVVFTALSSKVDLPYYRQPFTPPTKTKEMAALFSGGGHYA